MQAVVDVIVPLRITGVGGSGGAEQPRGIVEVLERQIDVACRPCRTARRSRQLAHDVRLAAIVHGVDGVEAQAVEVVLREPVERVVNEEVAHGAAVGAVEVDRRTPRRAVPLSEELRRVAVQVIALRAEMVVDHVEQHRQSMLMSCGYQGLEILRAAVTAVRGILQHAVVAPAAFAGKGGERHELDGRDAEACQMPEARRDRSVGARRVEGTDVQFVDDRARPRRGTPVCVRPRIGIRIDHLARAVYSLRIETRGRVCDLLCSVDAVAIERARLRRAGLQFKPATGLRLHGQRRARLAQQQFHALRRRRPQPETHLAGRTDLRAERHLMSAPERRLHGASGPLGRI